MTNNLRVSLNHGLKRVRLVLLIFVGACGLALAQPVAAADPTAEPILRVETGMHTTMIRRLVVDAPRNRLITCSDDKTVRIWQMPEARLISTLRVPIDAGHEGQLFAIAISPDGKKVVAGGWTGWDWDGVSSIYFFDVETGDLIRRYSGFKDAINTLTWTRDGKHLIVGLQARAGLHLLRLSDMSIVASDTEYLDKIMEVDVRQDGIVASTALDGMTRLYDHNLKILGRRAIPGGAKPSSLRFSPDGNLIAIGFIDVPAVTVVNTRDLSLAFSPDSTKVKEQASFTSVAWSSDGRYLYAGGDYRGNGSNPLYRWGEGGKAAMERIPLADNRIAEIQQMGAGNIAFVSEDPSFGIIGPDARRIAFRGPDIIDYSDAQSHLAVSADGSVIRYPLKRGGQMLQTFSPGQVGDQNLSAAPNQKMSPPLLKSAEIRIDNWKNSFTPTINGKPPDLDDYEQSRSYAIAPDHKALLLGTEWALRLLDRRAKEIWSVKLPAVAWAVNITQNGRLAVAALSDGTIRWYRMSDGAEMLAYFPHRNGQDWISWVPDGYYMSSVFGDNFVGWHLNRGRDLTPDFYRAVQFDRILYRPDVVAAAFRAALSTSTRSISPGVLGNAMGADFEIARLREIAPPRLRLLLVQISIAADGRPRLILQLQGERNQLDMKDVTVFVNNIPVTPSGERRLSGSEAERFTRRLEVDLSSRTNDIRVEAFNGVSMGVVESYIDLPESAKLGAEPGDLYLLAVGVNVFPNLPKRTHLVYAANDAEEMAKAVETRSSGYFKHVYTKVLTDNTETKPDAASIQAALEFIKRGRPMDTIVIFLASHGLSDAGGSYYFLPRDALPQDLKALGKGQKAASLMPWTTFFDALRGAAGRRLLIVDTCQASNIEGRFEAHSLMKRSAASLFSLIVASKGDESSQEYAAGKHGLFTYALINALVPESDSNGDGLVSLSEVFKAAQPVVDRLHNKSVGPQTPQLISPPLVGELPLMRTVPIVAKPN
jgi:WD40 repeat protein